MNTRDVDSEGVSAHTRAFVQVHFCVLIWGFTAILGRVITLPAIPLVLTLARQVAPLLRLWTNTLRRPFVSPAARLIASSCVLPREILLPRLMV